MTLMLITWAAVMLLVGMALVVPLTVILLVSPRTRPVIVSAVKFVGWTLGAVALLALLGFFVVAPSQRTPQPIEIHNAALPHRSMATALAANHHADSDPVSVTSIKPDWVDQAPGVHDQTYQVAIKSGLWTTEAECKQALHIPIRKALDEYLTNYFGDDRAPQLVDLDPIFVQEQLIKRPLYVETVEASVGTMQQLHALLEVDDNLRSDLHQLWRQAFVSHRLRYAGGGFALVLGALAAVCGYLKLDLATGGIYTRRLRWASALAILLMAAGAVGICVL